MFLPRWFPVEISRHGRYHLTREFPVQKKSCLHYVHYGSELFEMLSSKICTVKKSCLYLSRTHLREANWDALVEAFPESQVLVSSHIATIVTHPTSHNDAGPGRERPLNPTGFSLSLAFGHVHTELQGYHMVDTIAKNVLRPGISYGGVEQWRAVHQGSQAAEVMAQVSVFRRRNLATQQQVPQAIEPSSVVRWFPDRD